MSGAPQAPLPYYLYLDSKIIGTAKQTVTFFEHGIFQTGNTVVLLKKYKHASNRQIRQILEQAGIECRIVNMGDIDRLSSGIIFYPFNAQSNARTAANRNLKHIFVTHGESSKAASVKPIIRIYDHVTTAGQAGIDRFLAHRIFSTHDVESGRLIKMGNTFVGNTGLGNHLSDGLPCIFYAPTWEGGIESENYSSLSHTEALSLTLSTLAKQHQTAAIVIRPHPNTGHRLKTYRKHLIKLMVALSQNGLSVIIQTQNLPLSLREKWVCRRHKITWCDHISAYRALFGLCDISAMETQLLNENIPYYLYWNAQQHPLTLCNPDAYRAAPPEFPHYWEPDSGHYPQGSYKDYVIDAAMSSQPITGRIDLLLQQIQ